MKGDPPSQGAPELDRLRRRAFKMAPEVGFEPTIRRGGLTAEIQEGAQILPATSRLEPPFASKSLRTSWVRFRINQNPRTREAFRKLRRKTGGIVVFFEAFVQILSVTGVYLARSLGADHVYEIHSLPKNGS